MSCKRTEKLSVTVSHQNCASKLYPIKLGDLVMGTHALKGRFQADLKEVQTELLLFFPHFLSCNLLSKSYKKMFGLRASQRL